MNVRKNVIIVFLIANTFAYVPRPSTGYPDVPYLYKTYDFITVKSLVYPNYSMGMYVDKYSDLNLNPAYIMKFKTNSIYFDFGHQFSYYTPVIIPYTRIGYDIEGFNGPGWLIYSRYKSFDQTPLYNLGLVFNLGDRMHLAIYNRAIFDYGAFYYYPTYRSGADIEILPPSLEDEVEYDTSAIFNKKNQQEIFGFQPGLITGFKLNDKVDLAFKLEYLNVNRDGEMYNSYWKENLHDYYYYFDDINVDISGKQMNLGIGLLYKLTDKITTGIFGGKIFGDASQTENALDTSKTWYEDALDTVYYGFNYKYYEFWKASESNGKSNYMNFHIENRVRENFTIRLAFLYNCFSVDYSMKFLSDDTSYSDRVYKYYDYSDDSYHKRRFQKYGKSTGNFNGEGDKRATNYSFFNSFIFKPSEIVKVFTGFYIRYTMEEVNINERYLYKYDYTGIYSIYKPSNYRDLTDYDRFYDYTQEWKIWHFNIPVGLELKLSNTLNLLLSVSFNSSLTEYKITGNRLYPYKVRKYWKNDVLKIDDEEINRFELYTETPPKEFNKNLSTGFGLEYFVKDKFKFYLKTDTDISLSHLWVFGFECNW